MPKPSKSDNLAEAKRIAARMLAMPPEPHKPIGKKKPAKARKRIKKKPGG